MSQAIRDFAKTYKAGADLSDSQFHFVKLDDNGDVVLATDATDEIIGVLQNKPEEGEPALVRMLGTSKVKAGGTIGVGAYVTAGADEDGRAQSTTSAGDVVRGIHVGTASADDGDIVEIQLTYFHHKA